MICQATENSHECGLDFGHVAEEHACRDEGCLVYWPVSLDDRLVEVTSARAGHRQAIGRANAATQALAEAQTALNAAVGRMNDALEKRISDG